MKGARIAYRDVPLGGGRSLRVGILHRDGEPLDLLLAIGHGAGSSWRERAEEGGLTLPPAIVSALTLALLEVGDTDLTLTHPSAPDVPKRIAQPEGGAS